MNRPPIRSVVAALCCSRENDEADQYKPPASNQRILEILRATSVPADARRYDTTRDEEREHTDIDKVRPALPKRGRLLLEEEQDRVVHEAFDKAPKGRDAEVASPEVVVQDAVLVDEDLVDGERKEACSAST